MKPTVQDLFLKHGSDRGVYHLPYGELYQELLSPIRDSATAVLELGVLEGCGVRAWREFFTKAHIYGIDNDPSRLVNEDRITSFHIDTTERDRFLALVSKLPPLDFVCDDSSHIAVESLFIVAALWERVKPGGLIVVEDIAKPEYLALFSAFKGATLHDRRKIRGQADDMLAVMRKPL